MGLISKRSQSPYARQRPTVTIDWAGMEADAARARAEVAAVNEQARRGIADFHAEADPFAQLVKRCHAIDQRQDAFERRLDVLDSHLKTITDLLKGRNVA